VPNLQSERHGGRRDGRASRRWRFYETPAGSRPVGDFLTGLVEVDALQVHAAMLRVRRDGLAAARALGSGLWEVRAWGVAGTFRVVFAAEGKRGTILLALVAFAKKTDTTPADEIRLARSRLREWRARGSLAKTGARNR